MKSRPRTVAARVELLEGAKPNDIQPPILVDIVRSLAPAARRHKPWRQRGDAAISGSSQLVGSMASASGSATCGPRVTDVDVRVGRFDSSNVATPALVIGKHVATSGVRDHDRPGGMLDAVRSAGFPDHPQ